MPVQLSSADQDTFHRFIAAFLPPRGNKRKNTRNELQRIHTTLHRVLLKYFGFGVTPAQVLAAFEALGYTIFLKKGTWHPDRKQWVPSGTGTSIRGGTPYEEYDAGFLYIDVEATTIAQLWAVTTTLSADTSPEKLLQQEDLVERIRAFQKNFR